jgi:hypothetical protein
VLLAAGHDDNDPGTMTSPGATTRPTVTKEASVMPRIVTESAVTLPISPINNEPRADHGDELERVINSEPICSLPYPLVSLL